jgi:hypothetical protein
VSAQPSFSHDDMRRQIAGDIGKFTKNPIGFAKYAYKWNQGDLEGSGGPRKWQTEIMRAIQAHLKNPAERHQPLKIAVSSGHGIGKSALISMLTCWAMSTFECSTVLITAGTGQQLATKTAPEVAKWFHQSINADWWDVHATSIRFKSPTLRKSWRTDFVTWSEHNTDPFAGLHNRGKRILCIFDEASAIADKVWEVTEGALTDEGTEIIWLAFGNPTHNTGHFRECFGKSKHRWMTFQIDSRTVEGTNKEQIQKWIEDYGEDSDFVRVRVRGEFPRAGSNQFIPSDVVAAARRYKAEGFDRLPKILSVDVARFGDDQSVVGVRQGRKAEVLAKYRGLDTVQVGQRVMEHIDIAEREGTPYDAMVIDGDGLGAGTIDYIRLHRYDNKVPLFEFHGGHTPNDPLMYFNRRAEVWGLMREWLKAQAEIPDDPELETDLTAPEYGFSAKQQIQLERKEDMKKRGLASPDIGDMLAMTFAVNVMPKRKQVTTDLSYGSGANLGWMG